MFLINNSLYVGSINELNVINNNNINYIINCSTNLTLAYNDINYSTLDLYKFHNNTLYILNELHIFIDKQVSQKRNVYILCDSGKNISMFIGIFYVMNKYKLSFNYVFNYINSQITLDYNYFLPLRSIIIDESTDMDID